MPQVFVNLKNPRARKTASFVGFGGNPDLIEHQGKPQNMSLLIGVLDVIELVAEDSPGGPFVFYTFLLSGCIAILAFLIERLRGK